MAATKLTPDGTYICYYTSLFDLITHFYPYILSDLAYHTRESFNACT